MCSKFFNDCTNKPILKRKNQTKTVISENVSFTVELLRFKIIYSTIYFVTRYRNSVAEFWIFKAISKQKEFIFSFIHIDIGFLEEQ